MHWKMGITSASLGTCVTAISTYREAPYATIFPCLRRWWTTSWTVAFLCSLDVADMAYAMIGITSRTPDGTDHGVCFKVLLLQASYWLYSSTVWQIGRASCRARVCQ